MVGGCGGGDEAQKPPETPPSPPVAAVATTSPPAAAAPAPAPAAAKPTLAELETQNGKAMLEARNAHDAKKVASLYADDAVVTMAGMPEQHGRADVEKESQQLFDGYKDSKFWASRVFVKKDMVVLEWGWSGTNNGEMMGMKATNKQAGTAGLSVMWFNDDGLIKKENVYMDMATVMAQLTGKGKARAVPTPPASVEVHTSKDGADEAKNMDLVKGMYAGLDSRKEADFLGPMTDDVEYNDYTAPQATKGKGEVKKFFTMFTKAFPDGKSATMNMFGADDFVVGEVNLTGTHKGQFGPFAATKKPVSLHAAEIFQVKDGKVVRGWTYANNAEFLTEIGALKAPTPPAAAAPKTTSAMGKSVADVTKPAGGKSDKASPNAMDKASPNTMDKASPNKK